MKPRMTFCLSLAVIFLLHTGQTEAGWKFWKKDPTTTTTIEPPLGDVSSTVSSTTVSSRTTTLRNNVGPTAVDTRRQSLPRKPSPGTEVGLDLPGNNRSGNQGYRDWAIDLTGAGENKPKQPSPAPDPQGNRNQFGGVPTSTVASRPSSTTTSTTVKPPLTSGNRPNVPGGISNVPGSPIGERSWAEVAGGGSRPGSPTPATRSGSQIPTSRPASHVPSTRPGSPTPTSRRGSQGSLDSPGFGNTAGNHGSLNGGENYPNIPNNPRTTARPSQTTATSSTGNGKVYSSNPTYSKGKSVTDEDLEKLSEALFIKDKNNANQFITLNLQKETTGNSPTDQAPQPLFNVKAEAYQIPTIEKVRTIYDNYHLDTRTNEYINPAQRQEESLLVDTFLSTNVMSAAMRFLADKELVRKDYYEYKDTLRRLWFDLFSRGGGKLSSAGFEHVFLAEQKPNEAGSLEVSGLHNWIYYSNEEANHRANYLGYIKKKDLGNKASLIKIHTKHNDLDKPVTTMFVGTSPELEMALYTVCFLTRPEQACPVSLGGNKFNIITHKFRYRGKDLIGSAYPEF
ncbi:endoribonuclease CG2145-like [Prorops nasuta]|uniref:endoribonuclease CG2145-like n=1 Tax=Prorops nasuta TaxID=863751 RepID=UPI0034CFE448